MIEHQDEILHLRSELRLAEGERSRAQHSAKLLGERVTALTAALAAAEREAKLWREATVSYEATRVEVNELLASRDATIAALSGALKLHHDWHLNSGTIGLPDGDGGWIEMDNAAEYSDSEMCQRTIDALSQVSGSGEDRLASARREGAEAAAKVMDDRIEVYENILKETHWSELEHNVTSIRLGERQWSAKEIRALYPAASGSQEDRAEPRGKDNPWPEFNRER